jgi:hypothetical protein
MEIIIFFFINTSNFGGLIQNGDGTGGEQYETNNDNITIQNVKINGDKGALFNNESDGAGWLCHHHFIYGTITNCSSSGDIPINCGGILGSFAALAGTITINNCYSTGNIADANSTIITVGSVNGGGGIFGSNAAFTLYGTDINSIINISNCYSTGSIGSNGCGGIFGSNALNCNENQDPVTKTINDKIDISNCYSTGSIGNNGSGGIFGIGACTSANWKCEINITNCYSTGTITGFQSGDIFNSGGIFGGNAGVNIKSFDYDEYPSFIYVNNCYSFGASNISYSIRGDYYNYYGGNPNEWKFVVDQTNFTQNKCFAKVSGNISFLQNGLLTQTIGP